MKKYRFGSLIVLSLLLVVCFCAAAKADTINKISASGEVINIQTSCWSAMHLLHQEACWDH